MQPAAASTPFGWKQLDTLELAAAGIHIDQRGTIHVPYRRHDGSEYAAKLFHPDGTQRWSRQLPDGVTLFGLERVPAEPAHRRGRRLWIAEGESDALSLREHYAQWRGRPVDVTALPGSSTWRDEWAPLLTGYDSVSCFPDADEAGERMSAKIAATATSTRHVRLPAGRDVRSILQSEGPALLDQCIAHADRIAAMYAAITFAPTPAGAADTYRRAFPR